jgi:hypothetical protein
MLGFEPPDAREWGICVVPTKQSFAHLLIVLSLGVCMHSLMGCERDSGTASSEHRPRAVGQFAQPRLLLGNPDSPAHTALYDLLEVWEEDPAVIEVRDCKTFDRTLFDLWFVPSATIEQINSILLSVDGSVVGMTGGVHMVLFVIPDPGSMDVAYALKERISAMEIVRRVDIAELSPYREGTGIYLGEFSKDQQDDWQVIFDSLRECNLPVPIILEGKAPRSLPKTSPH